MSKILYIDCPSGISGDMSIGALIDAGVDKELLKKELEKLGVEGYTLSIEKSEKNGITGTKFNVILASEENHSEHDHKHHEHNHTHEEDAHTHPHSENTHTHNHHEHNHTHEEDAHTHPHSENAHTHNHHEHNHINEEDAHTHPHSENTHTHAHHEHNHTHEEDAHTHQHSENTHTHNHHEHNHTHHNHSHEHRNLSNIENLIDSSELNDNVKQLSKRIFKHVAIAEAKIHGKSIDEVHFHEVGAVDSIVDIVGVSICIDILNVDMVYSSNVHVGSGFVRCAHGLIPVPAPATFEILKGIPIYSKGIKSELVTPTGAAIIKELTDEFIPIPEMKVTSIGYGIGTKSFDEIPNILRVVLGESKKKL